jgi:anti-sigma B factor antagonist
MNPVTVSRWEWLSAEPFRYKEEYVAEGSITTAVRAIDANVSVIDIGGSVTRAADSALTAAYTEASGARTRAIVLNFSNLEYMNSSGIGLLVTLLVRAQRKNQQILACGLTDHYRDIFRLTRLDEAIHIHTDEEAAINAAATI